MEFKEISIPGGIIPRKGIGEINMERARYLQSTDEMYEEMLSGT